MKMIVVIMTAFLIQVSAYTRAQQVTIKDDKITLQEVFAQIRKQTGYTVLAEYGLIKETKPLSLSLNNVKLEDALKQILAGQKLNYEIKNKAIVITEKEGPSFLDRIIDRFDNIDVRGTVLDEKGLPLAGATVILVGYTNIKTDRDGKFYLQNVDEKALLRISYVGYEEVEIKPRKILNIRMLPATSKLNEVTINKGYYTEKQELSTGNVSKVTADEIDRQPVGNALQALQGRVPGLYITQNSGIPGGSFSVNIRGLNSISQGTSPFFVIDGVPYISQMPATNTLNAGTGSGNPLNYLNPEDIESVEVLKDADATSIFGSRAANGAILITTKKGKIGRTSVSVKAESGFNSVARTLPMMNTEQYLSMRREALRNDGVKTIPSTAYDLNGVWDQSRYTDWTQVLTQNLARYSNIQASLSGGSNNTTYLLSANYNQQGAGLPAELGNNGANKVTSIHYNLSTRSADQKFRAELTTNFSSTTNTLKSVNYTAGSFALAPNAPALFNEDGSLNWAPIQPGQAGTWTNPYSELLKNYTSKAYNLIGNGSLDYSLLPGLDLKLNMGYTNLSTDELSTIPSSSYDPAYNVTSGQAQTQVSRNISWNAEPQVSYTKQVGRGTLSTLVGASYQSSSSNYVGYSADGFSSDALLANMSAASNIRSLGSNSLEYKYNAVFARASYNLMDRYIVNLTGRRDGSSRFGSGRQFANFGSVGAAWIFSKEKFVTNNVPFLSFGKLRLSYGSTGNDQIGDYRFLDIYNATTNYSYQSLTGLDRSSLSNPELRWELTRKLDVGLDLSFFHDRIALQTSYYRNRSSNQLIGLPLSEVTGFNSVLYNSDALIQNKGFEFVLRTLNIQSHDFQWSTNINLSLNRNKVLKKAPGLVEQVEGVPVNAIKVNKFAGVNPATGLYQFYDQNGNLTYSPPGKNIFYELIDPNPKYFGGVENSLRYKSLTLSFLLSFVDRIGANMNQTLFMPGLPNLNQPVAVFEDHWQKPGDIATYQRFGQQPAFSPGTTYLQWSLASGSTFGYSDASYVRLKNVALNWQLPDKWTKNIGLKRANIYVQSQNLLTFTNFNGVDPESGGASTPPLRTWIAGFQINL